MTDPIRPSLALAALLVAGSAALAGIEADRAALDELCVEFSGHDLNEDGLIEIEALRRVGIGAAAESDRRGLVLVVVEERLLQPPADGPELDLRPSLRTFVQDLGAEGWDALTVAARVYAGPVHQDGRTLLAMRRLLAALRERVPGFAGVVMVGDFPEAYLVRSYNWRLHRKLTLNKGQPNEEKFGEEKVHHLRTRAEPVAVRAEIVLADLDGDWERRYRQERREIRYDIAAFPDGEQPDGGRTPHYETGADRFEDFFWINDGRYQFRTFDDGSAEMIPLDLEDEECAPEDLDRPNPIARPEISVSRINPRRVALRPKKGVTGSDGEQLLSAEGVPQEVKFARAEDVPRWLSVWERDPALERHLLIEYFARNHRYRAGEFAGTYAPASFGHGLGSGMDALRGAAPSWSDFGRPGYDVRDKQATVAEAIRWLKRPALLRTMRAHSDPWGSSVEKSDDADEIEREAGGRPWSWVKKGDRLVPGLGNSRHKLDFAIFRTLWANRILPDSANMWLHIGCDGISPARARERPYSDPEYGYWQGAEGLLYYCNGLVLVGRAKVFYDSPKQFCQALCEGQTWGEAWRRYFQVEAAESDLKAVGGGIGRKRSYFWSLLGDWTLTLGPVLDAPEP